MTKRMIIMLIVVTVVFGSVAALIIARTKIVQYFIAHQKQPPVVISAEAVKESTWQPYLTSVGTLIATQNVNITTEAAGTVTNIYFTSGDYVEQEQLLIDLDTQVEAANLANNKASLQLAKANYERETELYKSRAVPKSQLDSSLAKLEQAQASVAQTEALLQHKHIKAPFAGQLGIRQVNLGEYLMPGNSTIVNIQAIDPMYVEFSLPQQDLNKLTIGQTVKLHIEGIPDNVFDGKIEATNVGVDSNSRMLLVRASIPNQDKLLKAGMFADVKVMLPAQDKIITVPQTAINYNLYGDFIYVLEGYNKGLFMQELAYPHVKQAFVKVGQRQGDRVVIIQGLNNGDRVVTAGQVKLYNGAPVEIKNDDKVDQHKSQRQAKAAS